MSDPISPEDESVESLVAEATNAFMDRVHRGEGPDVEEYARRYPQIAGILRQLLPAVRSMPRSGAGAVSDGAPDPGPPEPLGCLGDFRLIREIGRGGMGVVYEGEQISLGRRVALKVLPFAGALDPKQLQRFRREVQAAAHLDHTNIVHVHFVGCERGVHYYAMQFIDGQSLAEMIHRLQQLPGGDAAEVDGDGGSSPSTVHRPPSTRPTAAVATVQSLRSPAYYQAVARLGVQAAEALEYAHGLGVVHRDVKPGNLLADAGGKLWITDFGLAQFQGDVGLTQTGDLVGTLRYMSPEQALSKRGLVDHRTDLYSLGATLYELLTLRPAFDGRDREELLRQIAFEEPPPPRRLNKAIPADLETIVLKAMARDVEKRYATAQELAEDLRRFLDQKPIQARRPGPGERAAKWARRHKAVVATAVLLLVLAAVGFAVSTALVANEQWKTQAAYERIAEEQARTKAAYDAEFEQRARAEKSFRQAREAVDFLTQISQEDLAGRPELQELRRKLLQAALAYYKDFIEQRGDDPSVQAELMESHLQVAGILDEIGSKAEAKAALERARQIEEKLPPERRPPFPGRGPPGGFPPPGVLEDGNLLLVLAQKAVQEELKLSEDQAKRAARLAGKRRDVQWESRGLSPEEARPRFEGLAAEEKALVAGLRPEQAGRLRQIALQQRDADAFNDPKVAEALGLAAEQKDKMRAAQAGARRAAGRPPGPGGFGPEGRRKAEEFARITREQLLKVLTPEQKAKWDEMTGDPFKGPMPPFRPPPGPRHDRGRPPAP